MQTKVIRVVSSPQDKSSSQILAETRALTAQRRAVSAGPLSAALAEARTYSARQIAQHRIRRRRAHVIFSPVCLPPALLELALASSLAEHLHAHMPRTWAR